MEKKRGMVRTARVILTGFLLYTPFYIFSQDMSSISKEQPAVIHGNSGASFTFNTSNESTSTPPPYEWNLFGDYTMKIYGIELPFSFVINQYSETYSHPFTQFGIHPSYKWATLHFGYSSMQLSPLSSSGHSFNGLGVELTPGKFRFSAFYGHLRSAANDPDSGQNPTPAFSGNGYGLKLGIGTQDNYFNVTYFHAQGNASSSENTVIGADFKCKILKVASFLTNLALSGSNLRKDEGLTHRALLHNYSWAIESEFSLALKNFITSISYRYVQPGFKMFGDPYTLNDGQIISLVSALSVARGNININSNINLGNNAMNTEYSGEINVEAKQKNNTISGDLIYYRIDDKKTFTMEDQQNNNLTVSLTYTRQFAEKSLRVSINSAYNQFAQYGTTGSSLGATLASEANLLKNKNLLLNGSIGYVYINNHPGESKGNILASFKAGYKVNQNTTFNFFVDYRVTPVYRINHIEDYIAGRTTTNTLSLGISFTRSF